jgi:hypothetical protein
VQSYLRLLPDHDDSIDPAVIDEMVRSHQGPCPAALFGDGMVRSAMHLRAGTEALQVMALDRCAKDWAHQHDLTAGRGAMTTWRCRRGALPSPGPDCP